MPLNFPHLHLILVHLPVVLVPTAMVMLLIAHLRALPQIERVALWIFVIAALILVPTYLVGEEAEEAIEHLPGIVQATIEQHSDSAFIALCAGLTLGFASLCALFLHRRDYAHKLIRLVLVISLIATVLIAIAANKGGEIRHPEAFENLSTAT